MADAALLARRALLGRNVALFYQDPVHIVRAAWVCGCGMPTASATSTATTIAACRPLPSARGGDDRKTGGDAEHAHVICMKAFWIMSSG